MSIKLHLFGAFRLTMAGQPVTGFRSEKARALLAYLAVEGKTPVRRNALTQLLWAGYATESASASLRTTLTNLNQLFKEHKLLHITYHTVQFIGKAPACVLDMEQVEALLARSAATLSPPEQIVLHHYLHQPFLQGMEGIDSPPFVAWLQARRARYQCDDNQPPATPAALLLDNLPAPVNRLIGRTDDLAAAGALLATPHVRLVTLVGPPGVGKSRLALALAAQARPDFAQGVSFVSLAAVQEPEQVALAISQALGLQRAGSQPVVTQLSNYLRAQQLLLLLDNFEQVAAAGPVISRLLTAAPQLKVLVTSRVALHLSGEWEYVVRPLALTKAETLLDQPLTAPAPAVALFVERAQAVRPDFQLTVVNQVAVAELCQRLDGLPLAIELAAARSRIFAPHTLLEHFTHSAPAALQLLSHGPHDLPERHRTLLAAIQWSYQLLPANEQKLLARLAIFVGGFTLAAASAVCGAAAEGVETLLNHSLLQQSEPLEGNARFALLETVRVFALAQLDEADAARLRQQHATYFIHWAQMQVDQLHGPGQVAAIAELRREQVNWLAALTWAADNDLGRALQLATALRRFWLLAGNPGEGFAWLQRLSTAATADTTLPAPLYAHARLATFELAQFSAQPLAAYEAERTQLTAIFTTANDNLGLGRLYWLYGRTLFERLYRPAEGEVETRYAQAGAALYQSLTLLQTAGYPIPLTYTLLDLSHFYLIAGQTQAGLACCQQALTLCQSRGDHLLAAQLHLARALNHWNEEEYATAIAACEAGLTILRTAGGPRDLVNALAVLALILVENGAVARGQAVLAEAQVWAQRAPDHMFETIMLHTAGLLAERQGERTTALRYYVQSLLAGNETGSAFSFVSFFTLCSLLVTLQQEQAACDGLQIFQTWYAGMEERLPARWRREVKRLVAMLHERFGPAAFASAALPTDKTEVGAAVVAWLGRVMELTSAAS